MMRVSRRSVLLAGAAIVAGGGAYYAAFYDGSSSVVKMGRAALKRVYGQAGEGEVAELFLADAEVYLEQEIARGTSLTLQLLDPNFLLPPTFAFEVWLDFFMVHRFAMSTNVIIAHETGDELEYAGFFDPLQAPCSSQLSYFNGP